MWTGVLRWIFGESPLKSLADAYSHYRKANTDDAKIRAEIAGKQIDGLIESQKLSNDVRVATANYWEMRLVAILIVMPFVAHLWLVWLDTILNDVNLAIPAFPAPMDQWQAHILLSFFGVAAGLGVAKIIAGAVISRR